MHRGAGRGQVSQVPGEARGRHSQLPTISFSFGIKGFKTFFTFALVLVPYFKAVKGVSSNDSARLVMCFRPVVSVQRIYDGKGSRRLVYDNWYDISSVTLPARIWILDMGVLLGEEGVRMLQLKKHSPEKLKLCSND